MSISPVKVEINLSEQFYLQKILVRSKALSLIQLTLRKKFTKQVCLWKTEYEVTVPISRIQRNGS